MSLPFVLVSSGLFIAPSQAFRAGCERLQPYLANVDNKFWQDHEDVLTRVEVGERLHPNDQLKVQAILEAKPVLDEPDVAVVIEILNLAS
jgi:sacsin